MNFSKGLGVLGEGLKKNKRQKTTATADHPPATKNDNKKSDGRQT
jgi:hypothetical protein